MSKSRVNPGFVRWNKLKLLKAKVKNWVQNNLGKVEHKLQMGGCSPRPRNQGGVVPTKR